MSEDYEERNERELVGPFEHLGHRATAAIERSRELREQCDRLMATAQRIAGHWHSLRASNSLLLKDDVSSLARTLRESGATPERALILLKSAIEPALVELPDEREEVLGDVVRWFVDSYFAA